MAKDFIPTNHDDFLTKLNQFITWLEANGAARGFSAAEIAAIKTVRDTVTGNLPVKKNADTAAVAANAALVTSEGQVESLWRPYGGRIQKHQDTTNEDRVDAGLTVPKATRTRRVVGSDVPDVIVEVGVGKIIVHWGTDPSNEARNKKPGWAVGVNIYLSINNGPEFLAAFDEASPYVHALAGPPVTITVRAAYRAPGEGQIGSKSAAVTVSAGG